jgi:hypothetical protein
MGGPVALWNPRRHAVNSAMHIQILETDCRWMHLKTRMPFKYGIATMTRVPLAFVWLKGKVDGQTVSGVASDLLPPKWFTKIPEKPLEEEIREMLEVIAQALRLAAGQEGPSVFALWRRLYAAQLEWGHTRHCPPLLANFGTSLVERALIEAVCRAGRVSFAEALRQNLFAVDLGGLHPSLAGRFPVEFLPEKPLGRIIVRHTVGLADPLTEADIPAGERLEDGLPQSLEESIRVYGLGHFKIKLNGHPDRDTDRLAGVARILLREARPDFAFSVDGNEQFKSLEAFRAFWSDLAARPSLREFFRHLMFVEQPLHREAALREEVGPALRGWENHPPLIIDESDAALEDVPAALRLGYAGSSHKNCKGVFKGLANCCLIRERARADLSRPYLMSGEDLNTIGPVSLLQDLAVMAALGIQSVERNGHHDHAGLSQLPGRTQTQVLRHHEDLYEERTAGWPALRIKAGEIELGSVNRAPFGVGFELEPDLFETIPVSIRRSGA